MRRRLLFVSYCFAPVLTPEAIQNGRTLRALHEMGWDVTVLTVDEATVRGARDRRLLDVLPEEFRIVKARSLEEPLHIAHGAVGRLLMHLGLPEPHLLWYPLAVRRGRELLARERFDAMHSWSSFQTSHVVALALRRASGLPWVIHLSDPWADSPYLADRPLQHAAIRRLERAVFSGMDEAVFITEETRDLVMRKYPAEWRDRTRAIPHGYLAEHVVRGSPPRADRELRLVHAGSFYLGKREPYALLEALTMLASEAPLEGRLRLVFVGPTLPRYVAAAEAAGLGRVVEWRGPVDFAESQAEVIGADAVVLIDAEAEVSVFLPSKLADYLAARRRIVGLTPERGATAGLLRRLGCPVVPPHDVPRIAAVIRDLLVEREAGPLRVDERFELAAADYEIRALTRGLDEALAAAMARRARAAPRS